MTTELWAISLVIITGIFGGLAPIFLKKGVDIFDFVNLKAYRNIAIGITIYILGSVIFIIALKGGELSVLYPLVGLSYIWTYFYSIIFLKEKITFSKWLGIILVVLGVFFVSLPAI